MSHGRPEIRGTILESYAICESCFNRIEDGDEYVEKTVGTCHPVANFRKIKYCKDCAE